MVKASLLFQSTRPSRASTLERLYPPVNIKSFQSTRPSRASTFFCLSVKVHLAFQSTRPSRASTLWRLISKFRFPFQSTRPSRASTNNGSSNRAGRRDFNPQGPRGPRQDIRLEALTMEGISIHKALAGLDVYLLNCSEDISYFNPQGPRGPRRNSFRLSK